jgi:SAM-dependent methyltransferase/predicted metal-dependent enzyme (double-stranded beta helix superfamily)
MFSPLPKDELPESIQGLISEIESEKEMSPRRAREILQNANVAENDIKKWAHFDHPVSDSYGRKLVYDGGHFEIMAMSWVPGDYSAIHDHGFTQWGAVQIFGPAEHAAFLAQDGEIHTLNRSVVQPGIVLGVGHQLVHQMGNSSDERFMSLHMYGSYDRKSDITADARVFDLNENRIQFTNGGVFFGLPEEAIQRREKGPDPDFLTWLRNTVEQLYRLGKIESESERSNLATRKKSLANSLFSRDNWDWLEGDLTDRLDPITRHMDDLGYWKLIRQELIATAFLEKRLLHFEEEEDPFYTYAELYDDVIGRPCLEEFIAKYLDFFFETRSIDPKKIRLISLGCGTGVVETYMIQELGVRHENLLGIDLSEAMVRVAQRNIQAKAADILSLKVPDTPWDIAFSGLNVFQYLPAEHLEPAIHKTVELVRDGGYFVGDFITPDHVRYYPHVVKSKSGKVLSLRKPVLVEQDQRTFQQSEIININRNTDKMIVTYEGKHMRYLPALWRLRQAFEKAFKGKVEVFDAVSLTPVENHADTCPSTRYLVIAQKGKK